MATGYVAEFTEPPASRDDGSHMVPLPSHPAVAQQTVSFTASTQSSAFNSETRMIRIVADAESRYLVGASPTALATSNFLPANTIEYLSVQPGDIIAFYDGSS